MGRSLADEARIPTRWARGCLLRCCRELGPASGRREAQALRTLRVGNSGEIDNSEALSCVFFLSLLHVAELVEGRTPATSPL